MNSFSSAHTVELAALHSADFYRQLAKTWLVADTENRERIESAFPKFLSDCQLFAEAVGIKGEAAK